MVQQHLALLDPNGVLDPVGVLSVVGVLDLIGILDPAGSWIQMMSWLWLVSSQTHLGGGSCPVETIGEDTLFGGKLCWEVWVPKSPLAVAHPALGSSLCVTLCLLCAARQHHKK